MNILGFFKVKGLKLPLDVEGATSNTRALIVWRWYSIIGSGLQRCIQGHPGACHSLGYDREGWALAPCVGHLLVTDSSCWRRPLDHVSPAHLLLSQIRTNSLIDDLTRVDTLKDGAEKQVTGQLEYLDLKVYVNPIFAPAPLAHLSTASPTAFSIITVDAPPWCRAVLLRTFPS